MRLVALAGLLVLLCATSTVFSAESMPEADLKPFARMQLAPLPAGIEVQFSAEGCDLMERLAEILGHAEKEILVSEYVITDLRILQAFRAANHRGVVVVVLLDRTPGVAHYDTPTFLRRTGIPVVLARRGPQNTGWHNQRYLIIDREAVVLSSGDLTATARRNSENLLLLRQPAVVSRYFNCWLDEAAGGERLP